MGNLFTFNTTNWFSSLTPSTGAAILVLLSVLVFALRNSRSLKYSNLPLPPGPPGLPLIGNVFDVPEEEYWVKYKALSEQYGSDLIYLNMLGKDLIVLNSLKACKDLLEKRSAFYSSRPQMPMANDFVGFDWHFGFMPNDDVWKERRRVFTQGFTGTRAEQYRPLLLKAVRNFLVHLLVDPDKFQENARLLAGAFILDVTYGIETRSKDDPYIRIAEEGMAAMGAVGNASAYVVDFFPAMRWMPSWIPGVKFKKDAEAWRPSVISMREEPMTFVERAMERGDARPSIASDLLGALKNDDASYEERKNAIFDGLGSVYAGGSDTVVSSFSTFFLAMAMNPSIQKKAQGIIDDEVSQLGRLPDFTEYGTMPYIDAIVREVFRWKPVVPSVAPHRAMQDDEYNGYFIPSGATIIPNAYAILYNEDIYGLRPDLFDPSRYMDPTQTAIKANAPLGQESFGFGRRICPGLHVAVEAVTMVVLSVLAVFNVDLVEGEKERKDFGKYTSGLICHPKPFKIRITPRSNEAVSLVRTGVQADI